MRIAVLIIGLGLVMVLGLQSCTVMVGGELSQNEMTSEAGAIGIFMAVLFLLGAAFSMGVPLVSLILFVLAGVLGLTMGSESDFTDLVIWGWGSLILAVMSYFGMREKRKKVTAS